MEKLDMTNLAKFTFTKSQRLLTARDFQAMNSHRQAGAVDCHSFKIHQANLLFFVKFYNNSAANPRPNRLGLAITKKKVKRAHERNRIKRLTREYFRLHQHQLHGQVDLLLTIKQFSDDLQNEQIVKQLATAFHLMNDKIDKLSKS